MFTEMRASKQWHAVVALANADGAVDFVVARRLRNFLIVFKMVNTINGRPVTGSWRDDIPDLAADAHRILPELRRLLHSLATERGMGQAKRIVAEHEKHVECAERRMFGGSSQTRKGRGSLDEFLRLVRPDKKRIRDRYGNLGWEWLPRVTNGFRDKRYTDLLDPACEIARDDVLEKALKPGLGPVRICALRSCRRFFLRLGFFKRRGGRGRFCCEAHKAKFHMGRAERRDYMVRYRAQKLPSEAIRHSIEKGKRRRMNPARRRQIQEIRQAELRSRVMRCH